MNYAKAQKEIVEAILSGNRMARFNVDKNSILVTPDGRKGYIFPVPTIVFNIDKVREIDAFPVAEIVKPENELKLTPDLRLVDFTGKRMCRRLKKSNGKNTYVDVAFLKCFQNPYFYQELNNSLGTIVVTEGTRTSVPVGIIMPIRGSWDDGTYYGDK